MPCADQLGTDVAESKTSQLRFEIQIIQKGERERERIGLSVKPCMRRENVTTEKQKVNAWNR